MNFFLLHILLFCFREINSKNKQNLKSIVVTTNNDKSKSKFFLKFYDKAGKKIEIFWPSFFSRNENKSYSNHTKFPLFPILSVVKLLATGLTRCNICATDVLHKLIYCCYIWARESPDIATIESERAFTNN